MISRFPPPLPGKPGGARDPPSRRPDPADRRRKRRPVPAFPLALPAGRRRHSRRLRFGHRRNRAASGGRRARGDPYDPLPRGPLPLPAPVPRGGGVGVGHGRPRPSPGHLCLHFPTEGILFLADYDLTPFGPWYGDKPCKIGEFRRSARMLAGVGARVNVVSHEDPVHEGSIAAKMEGYLSVIDRREESLRKFLVRPRTRAGIVDGRIVHGERRPGPWFDYGEWALLGKHLEGMVARGEAVVEEGRYALR